MLKGQSDPEVLAGLARGRLREKRQELEKAQTGRVKAHHRFMMGELLGHIDYLDQTIQRLNEEIQERMRPFDQEIAQLDSIPGVNRRTAEVLIAEIGTDMSRFPSAGHLASWAGMCPGNYESGGKRKSGKTRKGSRWLRQTLVEAAHGAAHSKDTYLAAQYGHLSRRRGRKKAEVAVGYSILVIVYHWLTRHTSYDDLGGNYYDVRKRKVVERRLVGRLEKLGYQVTLTPVTLVA
jgi:transposase